jgi:hypothetical protein
MGKQPLPPRRSTRYVGVLSEGVGVFDLMMY